eukprot:2450676-Pyramimonas_sp.AAC.1
MELQSWAPPQLSANKTWTCRPAAQQDGAQAKKLQILRASRVITSPSKNACQSQDVQFMIARVFFF